MSGGSVIPFRASRYTDSNVFHMRTCPHRDSCTSFRQILPMTTLKILEMRQHSCGFSPCPQTKLCSKNCTFTLCGQVLIHILQFSYHRTDRVNHKSGLLIQTRLLFFPILSFIRSISIVLSTYSELFIFSSMNFCREDVILLLT